ncbi:hypothetical protein Scep_006168 [Stephania cephalantha]|uniref:Uncharacterized protein n=1 Tax=Stephania cephalantha TaxID=152367 RepID=A0AAP0K7K9_9MAGN
MPPTTDHQSFLGRSILSIRRNQVSAMETSSTSQDQELQDLDIFQKRISDSFINLTSSTSPPDLLSIEWLRKLLDVYLCCEAEFKAAILLRRDPSHITKPPMDRQIPDLVDRAVKSLDICNAVTNGVESVQHWKKLADIAVGAMEQKPVGEGQVRRARKALSNLVAAMSNEEVMSSVNNGKSTERAWSFGRKGSSSGGGGGGMKEGNVGSFRSLSMTVSRSWSAAKQIQAMAANLAMPRGGEATGMGMIVYIMSTVMVFVMWVLVMAIPCQDKSGVASHIPIPRQLACAAPMIGLQDRISEELKKREKNKGNAGLLEELQKLEKCSHGCIELMDSLVFPVEEEKAEEMRAKLGELGETCQKMEEGLDPLRRQVREVFHRMVRSRAEILLIFDNTGKSPSPIL